MPKRQQDSSATQKPRKKQAVTKTNDAATKALTIHIEHFGSHHNDPMGKLRHAICKSEHPEQTEFDYVVAPKDESPEQIPAHEKRHERCNVSPHVSIKAADQIQLDLSFLATCRLLYEEAHSVIWETNTFSFIDPKCVVRFLASLNPAQKRKLTNLHLYIRGSNYGGMVQEWTKALRKIYLNVLQSQQNLDIFQRAIGLEIKTVNDLGLAISITDEHFKQIEPFWRLRTIQGNEKITVVISNDFKGMEISTGCRKKQKSAKKDQTNSSICTTITGSGTIDIAMKEAAATKFSDLCQTMHKTDKAVSRARDLSADLRREATNKRFWANEASAREAEKQARYERYSSHLNNRTVLKDFLNGVGSAVRKGLMADTAEEKAAAADEDLEEKEGAYGRALRRLRRFTAGYGIEFREREGEEEGV